MFHRSPRRALAIPAGAGLTTVGLVLAVTGCAGRQAHGAATTPRWHSSPTAPTAPTSPRSTPPSAPSSDRSLPTVTRGGASTTADRAFWQAYVDDDPAGACSQAIAYVDGHLAAMSGTVLQECTASLGHASAHGSSINLGEPVVLADTIALVTVDGKICGPEAPADASEGCGFIPDLSADMPAADTAQAFIDALEIILGHWTAHDTDWTPDVLVNVGGAWRVLLPVADPSQSSDQDGGSGTGGGAGTTQRPWNDNDWEQTCASGGCGVPGLPPFDPGGGLSFSD